MTLFWRYEDPYHSKKLSIEYVLASSSQTNCKEVEYENDHRKDLYQIGNIYFYWQFYF
jgi:hypothetical protein